MNIYRFPVFILFISVLAGISEGTNVCGSISTNTTWTVAGSPYVITCAVTIASSATLTIDPGVTIKVTSANRIDINGKLTAIGSAVNPIVFTSDQANPTPGYWQCLNFASGANPSASRISYASISYGGWNASLPAAIYVNGSSPTFDHITVSNSGTSGIYVTGTTALPAVTSSTFTNNVLYGINVIGGSAINLTNSTISNNTSFAIGTDSNSNLQGLTGLTVSGNGGGSKNGIEYRGGSFVTTNEVWRPGVPWFVTSSATVSTNGSLTIQAGTTVKFSSSSGINSYGKFTAIGTATSPIVFASSAATPAPGNWAGLSLFATNALSQISYATISYAGQSSSAALYTAGSPTLSNLTVTNSSQTGLQVSGFSASPVITNSNFSNNILYGINLTSGGGMNLTNSTISNNGDYALGAQADTRVLGLSGLTITGNGSGSKNAIGYRGGSITTNELWISSIPWIISATTTVNKGASLTVNAGTTVKFAGNTGLDISGKLTAVGTSSSRISFTSNSAMPAAGSWNYIKFNSTSDPASQLSYATISYAGQSSSYPAALYITNSSPTLSNLTISNSSRSGVAIDGSSATAAINNSTITNNGLYGLNLTANGGVNLNNTTINNNVDYAIGAESNTRLLGLAAMTLTGNGGGTKDAVGYRPSFPGINTNEVWRGGVRNWIMLGSPVVTNAGSLTVEGGVNAKFGFTSDLAVYGTLVVTGTASKPAIFTSGSSTPAAGDWYGIHFVAGSASASQISYATISYAGGNSSAGGSIYINGSSPTLDHVTVNSSARSGIAVNGTSAPTIKNSALIGNAAGITNLNPSNGITARFVYWNSANGPSGAGPGSGQPVSAGVQFEPWLKSAPTAPQFFATLTHLNRTFNPNLNIPTSFQFSTALSGNWTLQILNTTGQIILTLTGSGATGSTSWDAKNSGGILQPDGTYAYELQSTTTAGQIAATLRGTCIIDRNKQLTLSGFAITPLFFSPNGDSIQDTAGISASFSFDDASWTLQIKNSTNTVVRTVTGQGSLSYAWDGKNTGGVVQNDGSFTAALTVVDGGASASDARAFTLDKTYPIGSITSPAQNQSISNLYQNGSANILIVGTISDLNLSSWTLEYGSGTSPTTWNSIASGTIAVTNGTIATWSTSTLPNGVYSIRLKVSDKAGNLSQPPPVVVTIGNFSVSQNVYQINTAFGETVTYRSVFPFAGTERLEIKNLAGQIIKTLFNGTRNPGSYNDVWNGINQAGTVLVPDGVYRYFATISSGTYSLTWDLSSQFVSANDEFLYPGFNGQDPFNNSPPTIRTNIPLRYPGKVSLLCSPTVDCSTGRCYVGVNLDCTPPTACLILDEYFPAGISQPIEWAGTDTTGAFRPDLRGCTLFRKGNSFAKNDLLLYGRNPKVTNVTVTPALFSPDAGTQAVQFKLTTFQNLPANVIITFLNQDSLTILRTITQNNVAAGNVSIPWDGKANNGMRVAPGGYTVRVTATTPNGQSKSQILTKIQY